MGDPDPTSIATARDLRIVVLALQRRLRAERHVDGVSPLGDSVLIALDLSSGRTPGDLAGLLRSAPQTLTRVLARLQERGLITRRSDPSDRRQSIVDITEDGRTLLKRYDDERDVWLAQALVRRLNATEQELVRIATQLIGRLATG